MAFGTEFALNAGHGEGVVVGAYAGAGGFDGDVEPVVVKGITGDFEVDAILLRLLEGEADFVDDPGDFGGFRHEVAVGS